MPAHAPAADLDRAAALILLVLLWSRLRGVRLLGRDGTLGWGLLSGLLFAVEFLLIYAGLALTAASRAVLFLYTTPFFVAVGAHFLLQGDRLTRAKLVGLAAAFAGLVVVVADGLHLPASGHLLGDLMSLDAAAL